VENAPLLRDSSPDAPLISVVIPCVNGLPIVLRCVESFVRQEGTRPVEVVVVDRCGEETRSALRDRFPEVVVIPAAGRPTIPALRAEGIRRARGAVIAITEDHCIAQPGWLRAVERAYKAGHRVVGGPVENGCVQRTVDWAAFFCEYARFMGPVPCGAVAEVPGNNCAYDRRLFELLEPELRAETWESAWHARLRELGVVFHSDPEMTVRHDKSFSYGYFSSQRYHYSRSFAGMRLHGAPWWKRWAYAGATLLLPGLLFGRMTATMARKRRHWKPFLRSLPVLWTFLATWAAGEGVGALLGPGRSLERVD
jgi:glycosyltransferase involved in cell wall biosynthesis